MEKDLFKYVSNIFWATILYKYHAIEHKWGCKGGGEGQLKNEGGERVNLI